MRKLWVLIVLCACGATAVGSASAANARIYVANLVCTGNAFKPKRITIACGDANFFASHLHYSRYGGRTAKAVGKLVENNCVPSCVGGRFVAYPGSVKLSDVQTCNGRLYYERIAWTFMATNPNPSRRGSVTIKPQACGGP
jgi:hypothetical protein